MSLTSEINVLSKTQLRDLHNLLDLVSDRQRQDFGHVTSDIKKDGTLITDCDRWSDLTLVSELDKIARGEGVLSEEGTKYVPDSEAYWVVDPLDGTTNFSAGIPHWAISVARFVNGQPQTTFLDLPALRQRIVAIRDRGVWVNGKPLLYTNRFLSKSACVSLCSRSIRILQCQPDRSFPGKIRLLGVASLNMASVALGQTAAALEATPKIWDLASAWLVLTEMMCPIQWLEADPSKLYPGQNLSEVDFPVLVAASEEQLKRFLPWGKLLLQN